MKVDDEKKCGTGEKKNWLISCPHLAVKNWEQYLSCKGPLRSKKSQPHTRFPNKRLQCREEGSPEQQAVKISGNFISMNQRASVNAGVLLKGLYIDLFIHKYLP